MCANLLEKDLESHIESWLCQHGGYARGDGKAFDRNLALDPDSMLDFIKASQPKAWQKHIKNYASANPEQAFIDRFCKEVSNRSLLDVLRKGIKDRGVRFDLVYWKPETDLNPDALSNYAKNILQCVRQLHYSPSGMESVDIVLFLNGIPIIAIELKNELTGQTVEDAVAQWRADRSPDEPIFAFKRRCLLFLAVDPFNVKMTTKLEGSKTYFLPLDQGSAGSGNVGGAGNPASAEEKFPVAHLWENLLARDPLLELLQKYLHLQTAEKTDPVTGKTSIREQLIFPRYHQWDVVHKLLKEVKANGPGQNYLIQHSAGSGKSNSIAWLAHRLSGLHDRGNSKIFRSVIIVTDRRVLDSQLQDTVGQFEQTQGLVKKIDRDSAQLRDAINDGATIIVTTLQKFPVIFREVEHRQDNFAIIVDEAHSSQTGQAAMKLKASLADTDSLLEEYAREENRTEELAEIKKDDFWQELASQGQHRNLSFFAFTATPKAKTLELFGRRNPDGKFAPFHIYSMRQAIEEGFILDVLRNYVTYGHYYKLLRKIEDDPRYSTVAGMRAATRFESLHPHNIAQKTAVMLDHFCNITAKKMGGRAKAMLVTASRLHAVRYMREFDRQIREKKLAGVRALVAFSGEVDDGGIKETESGLNEKLHGQKISEKGLPDAFARDFNILIVAEKYQTGFDEPQLHTMFVDKPLSDVKAVQTLSRLNRTAKDKEDTFVLDFVNTAEKIKKAFQPYYESPYLEEETDPNILYDIKARLDAWNVYMTQDVEDIGKFLKKPGNGKDIFPAIVRRLMQPLEKYKDLPEQKRLDFRTGLFRFVRLYGFISQLVRLFDEDLHVYAFFVRQLARALPLEKDGAVDLAGQIDLEYYKLTKTGEGAIELEKSSTGLTGIKGDSGAMKKDFAPLSKIVEKINKRFGTAFNPEDQVFILQQIVDKIAGSDSSLGHFARQNDMPNFDLIYKSVFQEGLLDIAMSNSRFFDMLTTQSAIDFLRDELKGEIWKNLLESNKPAGQPKGQQT